MDPDLNAIARSLDRLVVLQQKGPWDYIATVAVVLTLIVLIWYTIETYKLRKAAQAQTTETANLLNEAQRQNETSLRLVEQAQRQNDVTAKLVTEAQHQNEATAELARAAHRQNENAIMPILAIRVEPPQSRYARSYNPNEQSHLVLRNEGTGPAFNVFIEPFSAEGRELEFDHGSSVIRPGEERELTYHLQEGNSGTIGNVNELYRWINTGTLPDPLFLRIGCRSVSSTDYTFTFRFTPMAGTLAVLLEGMGSNLLAGGNDQHTETTIQ
jgi:hypothetical protein